MSKRDVKLFFKDILRSIGKIEKFLANKTFENFQNDDLLIDGVTRNLEVIGEAAKKYRRKFVYNFPKSAGLKSWDFEISRFMSTSKLISKLSGPLRQSSWTP